MPNSMPRPLPCPLPRSWRGVVGAMALLVLCAATASARAEEIKIGGTGAALGTMQLLANAYARVLPAVKITVLPSMGSSGGINAVLAGATQLGLSSRPLTAAEIKAGATALEYGRTPFVFATATANPAVGLSTQELVDIYAAKTDRWPDGTRLRLVVRPMGDSHSHLIKSLSPAMREAQGAAEQRKGMPIAVTDQDSADSIQNIPGALGTSTLALILSEKRQLKALKLNGIAPDVKSIADGSFPLQMRLSFVTGPKTPAAAQEFVAFVRSAAGRTILEQTGHWVK